MRIVGFLTAWNCQDWIQPCIFNVLKIVDELYVCVSAHHPDFIDLQDGTELKVNCFSTAKVNIIKHSNNTDPKIMPDWKKCEILNRMIQEAKLDDNDVIMIIDADEFYSDEHIKEIKDFCKTEFDSGIIRSRYFCIDLDHYIRNEDMERIFKYKKGSYFTPTQRFNPRPRKSIQLQNLMFHYTFLLNPEMKRRYWKYSPVNDPITSRLKIDWLNKIYMKWDLEDEEKWKQENYKQTGHYGFWYKNNDMVENNGSFFIYKEGHPENLKEKFKDIKDFRKIYG